jgi:urease accessory protein
LTRWPAGERLIQGLGVVIAVLGCYFLAQSLGAVA